MTLKWFRDKSLRFKLNGFVIVLALLLTGLGILLLLVARNSLQKELLERGAVIVRRLAESHAYQVGLGLADELNLIIRRMMQTEQGIEYVEFIDTRGKIVQTTDGKFLAQSDPSRRPPAYSRFDVNMILSHSARQGGLIHGVDGQKLYDFYEPIRLLQQPAESMEIAQLGSTKDSRRADTAKIVGVVRMAIAPVTLDQAMDRMILLFIVSIVLAVLLGFAAATLLTSLTSAPVVRIADAASQIARGDLHQQVEATSGDELGALAQSFNRMAENLTRMIRRIRDASVRVDQGRDQIQGSTIQFLESSHSQVSSLEEISSAITQMNSSLKGVAESVENLSASSEQTSSSIMEMAVSSEEVSGHIKSLSASVDETASSITEMVSSIQQVDQSIEQLGELIADTAASIKEMEGSIRQVEKTAASSHNLSEQVRSNAEMGMKSVEMTMEGMERIRSTVHRASEVISKLGSSSEEIGKILTVIDDVAEQTNLLALNAAIIAAQAGEHGKGFAVVAEEIRELAERTASSTKEIDALIKAVQRDVANAVQSMKGGSNTVEDGVRLSVQAGENLKKILDSARTSADMAKEIAGATVEQSRGIQSTNLTIEQVREMVSQITKATAEQKAGSEQIISAVENMREMTGSVNRATVEQSKGSKQISLAMEIVTEMVSHIMKATGEQAKGSEQIVKIVEFFKEINQKNLDAVGEMDRALSLLLEQTSILKQEISIFKM